MANTNSHRNRPFHNEAAEAARRATLDSLGISRRENRPYSLSSALLALASGRAVAGFEREISDELIHQGHALRSNSGFLLPTDFRLSRDMTSASASGGGYLVETQNISFVDMLRSNLMVAQMGGTLLSGLRGNVTIPKQTAAATAHWLANEGASIGESQPALGQVSLTPRNVGAYTEISRQLLLQANPSAEALVMNDLAAVVARAVDLAAIAGTGADGQPTGIIGTAGVGSVSGTSLGYAGILEIMTDVVGANAVINPESAGFVTTPAVSALLMGRHKVASTFSPLWEGNVGAGQVDGFRAMSSTACPTATAIFADWSSLLIGEWGILEIETNPYANFQSGVVGVRAIQTVDIAVRHPQSFSVATSVT